MSLFSMSEAQDFCLRWSSYSHQLSEALRNLLDQELLVDVTLACDGRSLRAHRAILSACSSYFQELFQESTHFHTIVILKDVKYQELEALVKFMYHGEVTVNHGMLPGFLHTAETLRVRGLTDGTFPGKFQSIDATKVPNCDQAGSDVDVLAADKEIELPSVQRLSLINSKRIKLEQPVASIFGHSVGIAPTEDSNSHNIDDENLSEQDALCPPKSEEHVHIASLDGLSQLVMPVIQDGSVHNSQYVGVCGNIPSQHHQLNQPLSHPLSHQSSNIGLGGNSASRPFRQRVLYNQEQLLQLEAWYRQDRYPSGALMREYADNLAAMVPNTSGNVGAQPMRQNVDYWFQNRRRKDFHPEVMQQREKKKLAKTLWGSYNGSGMPIAVGNSGDNNNHPENSVSSNR